MKNKKFLFFMLLTVVFFYVTLIPSNANSLNSEEITLEDNLKEDITKIESADSFLFSNVTVADNSYVTIVTYNDSYKLRVYKSDFNYIETKEFASYKDFKLLNNNYYVLADKLYIFNNNLELINEYTIGNYNNLLVFNNELYCLNDTSINKIEYEDENIKLTEIKFNYDLSSSVLFNQELYFIADNSLYKTNDLVNAIELTKFDSNYKLYTNNNELYLYNDNEISKLDDEYNISLTYKANFNNLYVGEKILLISDNSLLILDKDFNLLQTLSYGSKFGFISNNKVILFTSNSIELIENIKKEVYISKAEIDPNEEDYSKYVIVSDLDGNSLVTYNVDKENMVVNYQISEGSNTYYYSLNIKDQFNAKYISNNNESALVNNDIYLLNDQIEFSAIKATLNGVECESGVVLEKEGENILVLSDEFGFSKTYYLNVIVVSGIENGNFYNSENIPTITYTNLENANVLLNGSKFLSNQEITKFGNFSLQILGLDEKVVDTITFTIDTTVYIDSTVIEIENGVFEETPITKSSHATISWTLEGNITKLNGYNTYSNYTTYNPGNNTLTLIGENNYSLTIKFYVNPTINIVEGKTYHGSVLPVVSGGIFTLNDKPYLQGGLIDCAGDYKLGIYSETGELVKTYTFEVLPEALNVSSTNSLNYELKEEGIIAAVTNNEMYIEKTIDGNVAKEVYNSKDVIAKAGKYILTIKYKTYLGSTNSQLESYNSEDGTYSQSYYFEIKKGVNIKDGDEYFDTYTILFAGYENYSLSYLENDSTIYLPNFESGYILNVIGDYTLKLDDEVINFRLSPSLNVENSYAYIGNITLFDYLTFNTLDLNMDLTIENGVTSSNITKINYIDFLKGKEFGKGTYSLVINGRGNYNKMINFIVIDSSVISLGAIYNNGKSFEFNMYGVSVSLTNPKNDLNTARNTITYNDSDKIYSVGKHYFTFIFTLNGIETVTDDTKTVIYCYIKPVVTFNKEETTSTKLNSLNSAIFTIKDGFGEEYNYYSCDKLSREFKTNEIYDEVGIHYLSIKLDDISYQITFTIDANFILDNNEIENVSTSYSYSKNVLVSTTKDTTLLIDDKEIALETLIDEVGNHTLLIKGTNNYKKSVKIVIREELNLNGVIIENVKDINKSTYSYLNQDVVALIFGQCQKVTVNGEVSDFTSAITYDKIGYYTIVVTGSNLYSSVYMFTILDDLKINEDKPLNEYSTSVYLTQANATILLNDDSYTSGTKINGVGEYIATVNGVGKYSKSYKFRLINNLVYSSNSNSLELLPSTLSIDSKISIDTKYEDTLYKEITLDNENISSNILIDEIGNHTLSVTDINGKITTYKIVIKSDIKFNDLALLDSYDSKVVVSISLKYSEFILNDELLDVSNKIIDTVGNNKVVVKGVNDYKEEYLVLIKETNIGSNIYKNEKESLSNPQNYTDNAYVNFGDTLKYDVLLDSKKYSNGEKIVSFGNHKIEVIGVNNYKSIYYLYISLYTSLIDKNVYDLNVTFDANSNYVVDTDNKSNVIDEVGNHSVKFIGINVNPIIYEIVVRENISNFENNGVYTSAICPKIIGKCKNILVNGLDFYNQEFNIIGTYTLEVYGTNDYKNEYQFVLSDQLLNNSKDLEKESSQNVAVTITHKGNLKYKSYKLNDNEYLIGTKIDTVGNNKLEVTDVNDLTYSYLIIIEETNLDNKLYKDLSSAKKYEYTYSDKIIPSFNNDLIYELNVDGKKYDNKDITTYGMHQIDVIGVNNYVSKYYVYISLYTTLTNNETYILESSFESNANVYINDELTNNLYINKVGNHKVEFKGLDTTSVIYNIVVKEDINGFINNETYYNSVTPEIFGVCNVLINGVSYTKSQFNTVGNYLIEIYGLNDYKASYLFSIQNEILYSLDNKDFNKLININELNVVYISTKYDTKYKSITLNGSNYIIGEPINYVGYNELVFTDINNNTITYTINIEETELSNVLFLTKLEAQNHKYEYSDKVSAEFNNNLKYSLSLDGNPYSNLDIIDSFGLHTLSVSGIGGYIKNYYLYINLYTNLVNHEIYQINKEFESNASSLVDNVASNYIDVVGNHEVKFIGLESEITYNVVVSETISNFENNGTYNKAIKPEINGICSKLLINGNNLENRVYNEIGSYIIEVYGLNDYKKEYRFDLVDTLILNDKEIESYNTIVNDVAVLNHQSDLVYSKYELNGEEYSLNNHIKTIGNNKLNVYDVNGNVFEYLIQIKEANNSSLYNSMDLAKANMYEFNDNYHITFGSNLDYELKLDGNIYNNEIINTYGLHKIELIGVNEYKNTYYIYINYYYEYDVTDLGFGVFNKANGTIYVDDTLVKELEEINIIGNHKVKLVGNTLDDIYNFNIVIDGSISNLENNKDYHNSIDLSLNGIAESIYLNNELVDSLGHYNSVGKYEIKIYGTNNYVKTYNFSIIYEIEGVKDNGIYEGYTIIKASNVIMTLDGIEYKSGTKIDTVGNHKLHVKGLTTSDEYDYDFTICEILNGIVNKESYTTSVNIEVYNASRIVLNENTNDEIVLANGKNLINTIGNYTLAIYGTNGYKNTYQFIIKADVSNIDSITYYSIVSPKLLNNELSYKASLNGLDYDFSPIKNIGNYLLEINGVNGYKLKYTFAIKSSLLFNKESLKNEYYDVVNVINDSDVEINNAYLNNQLVNNIKIDTVGNNKLELKGENGYIEEYNIQIKEKANESFDNQTDALNYQYKASDKLTLSFTPNLKYLVYVDGSLYDNSLITTFGLHEIKIKSIIDDNYLSTYYVYIELNYQYKVNTNGFGVFSDANAKIYVDDKLVNNLEEIKEIGYHNVIFKGQRDCDTSTCEVTVDGSISNLDKEIYDRSLSLKLLGKASAIYLNDELVNELGTYNKVGNYNIKVMGLNNYQKEYNFTIKSNLLFNDNMLDSIYNERVTIKNKYDDVVIDTIKINDIVSNNYIIDTIGINKIEIIGSNGYSENYEVLIQETNQGIKLYQTKEEALRNPYSYFDSCVIDFGTNLKYQIKINDNTYNNEIITTYGLYKVSLIGVHYSIDYYLYIDLYTSLIDSFTYVDNTSFETNAKEVSINNKLTSNYKLNSVGYNEVKFSGINSSDITYLVLIEEKLDGISNNEIYYEEVIPQTNSNIANASINGKDYNFTKLNIIGDYELIIFGINGYENKYKFTLFDSLYANDSELSNNVFDTKVLVKHQSKTLKFMSYSLNDNDFDINNSINTIGNNILKVKDINSNEFVYNIPIIETQSGSRIYNNILSAKTNSYNYNDVVIPSFNFDLSYQISVDDKLYDNEDINTFGLHKIVLSGVNDYEETYYLFVNLDTNIIDNEVYLYSTNVVANASIYVDDKLVDNNALIKEVGYHYIKFIGNNLEEVNYLINIFEVVDGITNKGIYLNKELAINVDNAKLLLNGVSYESGTLIKDVGNYTLTVIGTNGYKSTYEFVNNYQSNIKDNDILRGSCVLNVSNAKVYLDRVPYEPGQRIDEIGNHEVKIIGLNGYEESFKFTIEPYIIYTNEVVNNEYVASFKLMANEDEILDSNNYKLLTIDSNTYSNNEEINEVGNHKLRIVGANGYEYSKDFTIEGYTKLLNDGKYNDKIVIDRINAQMTLDGKEITKDTVVGNGTHTLVINGANGYNEVITFTYYNPNIFYTKIFSFIVIMVGVITITGLFIKIKKGQKK